MSHHKSLGSSTKGKMRTEKGKTRLVDFQRVLHQNPHNSHGSCCSCTNSQGTRLQHPRMGPFFSLIALPLSRHPAPNTIHVGENHCRLGPFVSVPFTSPAIWWKIKIKKKAPWVLWKGVLAIGRGTAAAMAIVLPQLARGVNLCILERLKEINDCPFIQPFQPEWSVSMQPRGHDWPSWQNLFLSMVFRNYVPYSRYACSEIPI